MKYVISPGGLTPCPQARMLLVCCCLSSSLLSFGGLGSVNLIKRRNGETMKSPFISIVCRLLVALMIWTPYQIAQAGMIGTEQVVQQSTQSDRNTVASFMSRGEVASQLQAFGIDPATAKDRVASMSDEEVRAL